ncbi:MAG: hypothetical protein JWO78_219 [Micavibrio sp.]|nr:hypothetical protein [Micavibrio sp.]
MPWKNADEGFSLKAYQDVAKVWTACHGVAYVPPRSVFTDAECKKMDTDAETLFLNGVREKLLVSVSYLTLAAHAHFAYNIGLGAYSTSKALTLTNAGDAGGGCDAMLNWYKAGGRDCRKDKGSPSGCYGMWLRRIEERNVCLEGLK